MGVQRLGIFRSERDDDSIGALASWQRGCEIGFGPACANARDRQAQTAAPKVGDYQSFYGQQGANGGFVRINAVRTSVSTGWVDTCRRR
jgi:hypothetical protein